MHADILDQRESLRAPFTGSLALHVALIGGLVVYTLLLGHREAFGDPERRRRRGRHLGDEVDSPAA